MTMPTPERAERRADRIVEIARAFVADPNDDTKRLEFCRATFNLDWLAAAIVALADRPSEDLAAHVPGLVEALRKIAGYGPRSHTSANGSYQRGYDNGFNNAGSYAAEIARTALKALEASAPQTNRTGE